MSSEIHAARRVAARRMHSSKLWPEYTTDLMLEGMLALFDSTGDNRYLDFVLEVWKFRGRPLAVWMVPRAGLGDARDCQKSGVDVCFFRQELSGKP